MQNRIQLPFLFFHIDHRIIIIDFQPWSSRGKARLRRILPLHRRPCIVPAHDRTYGKCFCIRKSGLTRHPVLVFGTDIIEFIHTVPSGILHANLLPLINKRNSTQQNTYCTKHLCPVRILRIIRQKTGNAARLIVIFNDICLEPDILYPHLGICDCFFPRIKRNWWRIVPSVFPVTEHMGAEIKNCRKMSIFSNKVRQVFHPNVKYFPYRKCILFGKCMIL